MSAPALPELHSILAFNASNHLAVRRAANKAGLAFVGQDLAAALTRLEAHFATHTAPVEYFSLEKGGLRTRLYFVQVEGAPADHEVHFHSLEDLTGLGAGLSPTLLAVLQGLEPYLIEIPYLHLGENDFIYKFRPDKERNRQIYQLDDSASRLYQSQLCSAIKALARAHERTAGDPVPLNFGAIEYLIPSHFGFCLGVKNAIERAYETLAENQGRRVFMLSELIHNPFVNQDLLRRGLRYLQTEKGQPLTVDGKPSTGAEGEVIAWDTLTGQDIVIIPAFGATDDDKRRLVRKGVPVYQYDATCMLVEKVWKAARAFGREGFTVIIHGKHEHEETKATFSNARRYAPAVIVRHLAEVSRLTELFAQGTPAAQLQFEAEFTGKFTPGFTLARDLQRVAVVNQTTLLMNETLGIIDHLRQVYTRLFGEEEARQRVGGNSKRDTLCYATQVNQDALSRALLSPLDAAFVIGGKNSSNTFQLFRLCEERLGTRAYFIQSEENLLPEGVQHYHFPHQGPGQVGGHYEIQPLPRRQDRPLRILLTGGASCPDGVIQQVVHRLNGLLAPEGLRPIEAVLADLATGDEAS